jgi:transcription elongation factor S-II
VSRSRDSFSVPLTSRSFFSSPQESKAGLAVGKLRSHAAKDVSELAKEIVRVWKTAVDKEKQAAGTHSKGTAKGAGA